MHAPVDLPLRHVRADLIAPGPEPLQVIGLAGRPLGHVRQLDRRAITVTHLQVDRLAIEPREQRRELLVVQLQLRLLEEGDEPVRDLTRDLTLGDVHLSEYVWIGDNPALHHPACPVGAVERR